MTSIQIHDVYRMLRGFSLSKKHNCIFLSISKIKMPLKVTWLVTCHQTLSERFLPSWFYNYHFGPNTFYNVFEFCTNALPESQGNISNESRCSDISTAYSFCPQPAGKWKFSCEPIQRALPRFSLGWFHSFGVTKFKFHAV